MAYQPPTGSVVTFQSNATKHLVHASVSGTVHTDVRNSVAAVIIGGSVATVPPANQSVSGAVQIAGSSPSSIATVKLLDDDLVSSTLGLVTQGVIYGHTTAGGGAYVEVKVTSSGALTVEEQSGSVIAFQGGAPWAVANVGSIISINIGSIVSVEKTSSILAVPVGSTITIQQAQSIVGTYAEDAAAANADKGVFVLGVRNDTLASVTSADRDYGAISLGPSGEAVTVNAPYTKWVQGTASMLGGLPTTGVLTPIIAAQGASIFTYITGLQVANMGENSVLLTLSGATGTTVGYTVAPAGGGSNIVFTNALKTNANAAFAASTSGVASVYLSAQGFISKS